MDDIWRSGTMGYGLPAAIGVQIANPGKLVVDIAGEDCFDDNARNVNSGTI